MWTTVLLVFLSLIFSIDAQGTTNFEAQTVTDSTQPNQGIKWDTTGPSVTLSIRDGRLNNANSPRSERPNQPLFYSNEWQPYLMPIGVGYGNRQMEDVGDDGVNYQFLPTLLRRPDSDLNRTSPRQANYNNGYEGSFSPVPIPMAPIHPMFYYPPPPSSAYLSENAYMASNSNTLNNSSEPTARLVPAESDKPNLDIQRDGASSSDFGLLPEDFERYPFNFYRNGNFFVPHPAFGSPYSILSGANENGLPPSIFPFAANPFYGSETGADTKDTNTAEKTVPPTVKPGDIRQSDSEVVNGTPSDASSAVVPPDPYRFPFGAYPFGILPPPVLPNIFPNPPPTAGVPIQPLINDVDIPNEGLIADAVAAQPPLPTNIPLEPAPGGLPPLNTLVPNVPELPAAVDANVEGIPPEEAPTPAKIPYEFGFDMNDGKGTDQHRKEVSDLSGTVRGSYGYRDMYGVYRIVNYIADKNGFRAVIKSNEPGVASSGSANVVVMAEQPPPQAIAEGQKPDAIIVPDAAVDLIAEGSSTS